MSEKGIIVTWLTEKNFGFIQPDGTQGRGKQIFMRRSESSLPASKLREGTAV
jgi:cold shock CspA family protein